MILDNIQTRFLGGDLYASIYGSFLPQVAIVRVFAAVVDNFYNFKPRKPRRQPHRRSGLATLPSVGAVP